jgi:16S rRNA (cytidine1402-2'-O)-methyltransferase
MSIIDFPSFLPPVTPGLYLVATPIGNRGDMTIRALHTLTHADIIYCEDTRTSRTLLETYGIHKPLKSYHEHNEDKVRPQILDLLREGKVLALISDAGMPLISDPGFKLVRSCHEGGLPLTCVPGVSAVTAGLVLSGMPPHPFAFLGFVNLKQAKSYVDFPATLIFFESPHRLLETLEAFASLFKGRDVAVVREITKRFEEVIRGSFTEVLDTLRQRHKILGEIVLVLSPPLEETQEVSEQDLDRAIREALETYTLKDACTLVAGSLGIPKKQVYARALVLKDVEE